MRDACHANGGYAMLVLSRKNDEAVVIGGSEGFERMIKVTVLQIKNGRVKLGFEAAADVPVNRLEVWEQTCGETEPADHDTETVG
jgi:carbon storage regulator CsrA